MALRSERHVRQWELNNLHEYDTACPGSSALYAALRRNLEAEVATVLGKSVHPYSMIMINSSTRLISVH